MQKYLLSSKLPKAHSQDLLCRTSNRYRDYWYINRTSDSRCIGMQQRANNAQRIVAAKEWQKIIISYISQNSSYPVSLQVILTTVWELVTQRIWTPMLMKIVFIQIYKTPRIGN